jgi:hypothetical protein
MFTLCLLEKVDERRWILVKLCRASIARIVPLRAVVSISLRMAGLRK